MNIEIGVGIGSGLFAVTSSDRLIAYAWATAGNHSVSTSSIVHKTVNAVPATSIASGLAPIVSNAKNVNVLSVMANVNGNSLIPIVAIAGSVSISAVIASSNSNGINPTVSTIRNVSVGGVVANNTASSGVPTVSAGSSGSSYYLQMDGVDDYVSIPFISSYNSTTKLTVEANINLSQYNPLSNQGYYLVGKWKYSGGNFRTWSLNFDGFDKKQLVFRASKDGTDAGMSKVQYDYTSKLNQWVHVAGVFDNGVFRLVVDGVTVTTLDASSSMTSIISDTNPILIGAGNLGGDWRYKGNMKQVRIWNVARTDAELTSTMNSDLIGNETGLVGYWKLNEGTGTIINDSSLNANNATLLNGGTWVVA